LPIWEGTENILSLDVLRALDREQAHEPFVETVDERLSAVTHPALTDAVDVVEAEFQELTAAMATLAGEDREYAELSAKRLSHYIFDVFTAALLLEQAQEALDGVHSRQTTDGDTGDPDGRTAVVARRFVQTHLEQRDARGITGGDRLPVEYFDAVVNYAAVPPSDLVDPVEAD
jgi:hypothetical protein